MAAQRKMIDPAVAPRVAEPESEGWAPRPTQGSTSQSSPAHLLLLELSARLHQPTAAGAAPLTATMTLSGEPKWPIPMRLATIGVLSAASWGLVYLAIAVII